MKYNGEMTGSMLYYLGNYIYSAHTIFLFNYKKVQILELNLSRRKGYTRKKT